MIAGIWNPSITCNTIYWLLDMYPHIALEGVHDYAAASSCIWQGWMLTPAVDVSKVIMTDMTGAREENDQPCQDRVQAFVTGK